MNKKQEEPKNEQEKKKEEQIPQASSEVEERLVAAENQFRRALADYQNLQKRVAQERTEWIRAANRDLLLRLLPVLDTLMMAEKHIKDQGVTLSIHQFLDALKQEGVMRIKTDGEAFDPTTMECVQIEEGEDGKVLEELRAGYLLYDKVLRPAQVKVGKKE